MTLLRHYGLAPWLPPALTRLAATRKAAPPWLGRTEARSFARSCDPEPWRGLEGPRWWAQLADAVLREPDRLGFFDYFRRRGRAGRMPAQHPFLDLDLIDLVLRLPPEHGFDPHVSRPVLRRAMRGMVPEAVRMRRDKTYFDPLLVDCFLGEDRTAVTQLLGAADAEVFALADRSSVRVLLDDGPSHHSGGAASWMWDIWRLLTAECWLRSQADPCFPQTLLERLTCHGPKPGAAGATRSYVSQP